MSTMSIQSRQFNLEHARAGAPFTTKSGDLVKIVKWDMRGGDCPLLGFVSTKEDDMHVRWAVNGQPAANVGSLMTLVMTPLGYIDGEPFFVGDEIEVFSQPDTWEKMAASPHHKMRHEPEIRWPAPAKVYPTFTQKDIDTLKGWSGQNWQVNFANAALRHAIDAGQVFAKEDVDAVVAATVDSVKAELAGRSARDMAVANAVHIECTDICVENAATLTANLVRNMDLAAIIAKVPA